MSFCSKKEELGIHRHKKIHRDNYHHPYRLNYYNYPWWSYNYPWWWEYYNPYYYYDYDYYKLIELLNRLKKELETTTSYEREKISKIIIDIEYKLAGY